MRSPPQTISLDMGPSMQCKQLLTAETGSLQEPTRNNCVMVCGVSGEAQTAPASTAPASS